MRNETLREEYKQAALANTLLGFDASDKSIAALKDKINSSASGTLYETVTVTRPPARNWGDRLQRIFGGEVSLEEQFLLGPSDVKASSDFGMLRALLKKKGIILDISGTSSVHADNAGYTYAPAKIVFEFKSTEGPTEKQAAFLKSIPAPRNDRDSMRIESGLRWD